MNQYLYQLKLVQRLNTDEAWSEADRQIVSDHFNHLKDLTEKGVALVTLIYLALSGKRGTFSLATFFKRVSSSSVRG